MSSATRAVAIALGLALGAVSACNPAPVGPTSDAYMRPDTGPCAANTDCPGSYCNMGSHLCCQPAVPSYEICGDGIDQNCDGHDESCGDNDHDGVQACMPGESPTSGCDCDDENAAVRPPRGAGVAGAPELCDGLDNDCDGRIDESASCCPACTALGADGATRADTCTPSGACDCAGEAGIGPCAAGLTCCSSGCVDVMTSYDNCNFCDAPCTQGADTCQAGVCVCGATGSSCSFTYACHAGACAMM